MHIIFLQKKAILWIEDSYLSMKHWFEGTNILMMDLFFYKHAAFGFTRHELVDWSGVDYLWIVMTVFYQLFGRKDHLYHMRNAHFKEETLTSRVSLTNFTLHCLFKVICIIFLRLTSRRKCEHYVQKLISSAVFINEIYGHCKR